MSYTDPLATAAQLIERSTGLVDVQLPKDPRVPQYRLWGARTINDAYGAPTASKITGTGPSAILEVRRGESIRSPWLVMRGAGLVDESFRNQTRVKFDPEEFASVPGSGLPQDHQFLFMRVQEFNVTQGAFATIQGAVDNGDPVFGPISVIPNAGFFGSLIPAIALAGTAPANTTCTFGNLPVFHDDWQAPNPLHLILPRRARAIQIRSFTTTGLLVSFGPGMPMTRVLNTEPLLISAGNVKDIFLASADSSGGAALAVDFAIHASLALGSE